MCLGSTEQGAQQGYVSVLKEKTAEHFESQTLYKQGF